MKTRTDRWLYRRGPFRLAFDEQLGRWYLIKEHPNGPIMALPKSLYNDPAVPYQVAVDRNRDELLSTIIRHATGLAFCAFIVFLMWLIFTLVFSLGGVLAF